MPRFKGVYRDANGWYFKARTSKPKRLGACLRLSQTTGPTR